MTDCEIDNNDTKLMQLSNDLNSYCVNESINSDNTDLVDLNNKCLNGGFNSDHIDIRIQEHFIYLSISIHVHKFDTDLSLMSQ
jgi:hypothetical protein